MFFFPPTATDSYKTNHDNMMPEGTQQVYSNFTCRSDKYAKTMPDFDHKTVWFGLQGLLQERMVEGWQQNFFDRDLDWVLAKLRRRFNSSSGYGSNSIVERFANLHKLGYLPLRIKALPEGARVNIKVPPMTFTNTHDEFSWLTNYEETIISTELWMPGTSATTSFEFKRLLTKYAKKTGSPMEFVTWQGHDFSMRGMPGFEAAAKSGAGHLLSFNGSDTLPAVDYLEDYYGGTETFIGGSVPATEHSVMCMGGKDDEVETYLRLIKLYPTGVLSIVSDTWDFWKIVTETATTVKPEIMARQPDVNGLAKIVFRPDSGDPVKIICGDPEATPGTPAYKGAVQCLWEVFGGTTTATGHKLLDSHVGLIYGDSIDLLTAQIMLERLDKQGWASANIVLGIGSFTFQYVTRDTFGSAIKATFGVVNDEARELFKDPATDNGMKKSAKGLLRVELVNGEYVLYDQQTPEQEEQGELATVFLNGRLTRFQTLKEIRDRLNSSLYY